MEKHEAATAIDRKKLAAQVTAKFGIGLVVIWLALFLPAGSLAFWNGWLYLGLFTGLMAVALAYLWLRDPALLEKRLRTKERQKTQKGVILASFVVITAMFLLPGFDWRWSWSKVPTWLVFAALAFCVAGYALFVLVLRANSYLSRVVELQEGQRVIDSGPYALLRHPMYLATLAIYLSTPLVLGSFWALIPAACYVPLLVLRIRDEEALLLRELPGYAEYCARLRWRLLPGIW